jgi:SOS-response transcriptional repressor LexA
VRLNEALAETTRGELFLGKDGAAKRRGVPLLGTVADGYPQAFDAAGRPLMEVADFLYVPQIEWQGAFALHAIGDSMESSTSPSFAEGDQLVFAPLPVNNRDFAFVRLKGEPATFRQVFFETKGSVRLQPLNLTYAASTYDAVLATWRLVCHVRRL